MKKNIFIFISIFTLLIVGSVWLYLFVFGVPANTNDIFSDFNVGDTDPIIPDTTPVTEEPTSQKQSPLRQLTTRPTAGAVFVGGSIRYMERGTGHVYSISLRDFSESFVSGTTIARTVEALFSKFGDTVAVTTETEGGDAQEIVVGSLVQNTTGEGSFMGKTLPAGAREVGWGSENSTIQYTRKGAHGSAGYSYNLVTGTSSTLFEIPLRDIEVLWTKPVVIYTTPSHFQVGYIYSLIGNKLNYLTSGEVGLMASSYASGTIISYVLNDAISSFAYTNGDIYILPLALLPEKCIGNPKNTQSLFCAAPYEIPGIDSFPDSWYKGTISLSDALWRIDTKSGEGELLSDFLTTSGREIDVSQIGTDPEGKYIWFINKNDDTLWMYDTTVTPGT